MTDKEPTEAQICKEFWERCGLELHKATDGELHYFEPGGDIVSPTDEDNIPIIDLNNLFKYAVPKAIDKIMAEQECSSDVAYAILFKKWLQELELDMTQPAETLRKAIWEVIQK